MKKISVLGALSFSLGLIALAIFSQVSFNPKTASAALAQESCYDVQRYSVGSCTFHEYVCYISSTVVWNGGSTPAYGIETRAGGWGSNGWGYDYYSGNMWGEQYAGCF